MFKRVNGGIRNVCGKYFCQKVATKPHFMIIEQEYKQIEESVLYFQRKDAKARLKEIMTDPVLSMQYKDKKLEIVEIEG